MKQKSSTTSILKIGLMLFCIYVVIEMMTDKKDVFIEAEKSGKISNVDKKTSPIPTRDSKPTARTVEAARKLTLVPVPPSKQCPRKILTTMNAFGHIIYDLFALELKYKEVENTRYKCSIEDIKSNLSDEGDPFGKGRADLGLAMVDNRCYFFVSICSSGNFDDYPKNVVDCSNSYSNEVAYSVKTPQTTGDCGNLEISEMKIRCIEK